MSRRSPSARLFVAVDPPEPVALELAAWARSAARQLHSCAHGAQPALRVLDAELLHVTVCFLGERPVAEIPALAGELADCERPAVQLSLGAPLWLPPRRPRALAIELHDKGDTLAAIQAEVAARLEPAEQDERDHAAARAARRLRPRRFHPHITLARMRAEAGRHRRRSASERVGRSLPPTPALSFAPDELVLYRSWLSPEGANYEALSAFPIG